MSSGMSRRAQQAAETQQLILRAALKLFTAKGYGATSIGDIAAEAGVAVPTVYTSVGPKPELLRRMLDWVDQQADIPTLAGELRTSRDPARVLTLQVRIARYLAERCGDILTALASAAQVDSELAEAYQSGLERHREGARVTAERLSQLDALGEDSAVTKAAALIATLTRLEVWSSLHGDFGWSYDDAEDWISQTLSHQLLGNVER